MGRYATSQLVDLARITSDSEVLDAGSGIGGTARYVADRYGCRLPPWTSPKNTAKRAVG